MTIEIQGAKSLSLYDPGSHSEDPCDIKNPKGFKIDRGQIVFCRWATGNFISVLLRNGWMIHIEMPTVETKFHLYEILMDAPNRFDAEQE